jgi:hypothetical protein
LSRAFHLQILYSTLPIVFFCNFTGFNIDLECSPYTRHAAEKMNFYVGTRKHPSDTLAFSEIAGKTKSISHL